VGIEPTTCALRVRCSTPEPHQLAIYILTVIVSEVKEHISEAFFLLHPVIICYNNAYILVWGRVGITGYEPICRNYR
jgi:hypothetical protein